MSLLMIRMLVASERCVSQLALLDFVFCACFFVLLRYERPIGDDDDNDAEHSEIRAQLVRAQSGECHLEVFVNVASDDSHVSRLGTLCFSTRSFELCVLCFVLCSLAKRAAYW